MEHKFTVPGNPIPKGRPRLGRGGRVFTPQATQDYEAEVCYQASTSFSRARRGVITGPVGVTLKFFRKNNVRCDLDNLCKSVMDGINGAQVWEDDSQVVYIEATKSVSKDNPRVEVTIRTIDDVAPISQAG